MNTSEGTNLVTRKLHFGPQDAGRDVEASVLIESGPDEEAPGETVWYYVTVVTPGLPIMVSDCDADSGKLILLLDAVVDGEVLGCDMDIELHDSRGWKAKPVRQQIEDGGAGAPNNTQSDRVVVQVFERREFGYEYADDRRCDYDL